MSKDTSSFVVTALSLKGKYNKRKERKDSEKVVTALSLKGKYNLMWNVSIRVTL